MNAQDAGLPAAHILYSRVSLPRLRFSNGMLLYALLGLAVVVTLAVSLTLPRQPNHHFTYLAAAFARGSFGVSDLPPEYADKIIAGAVTYIPLAPLPALLLVPFASMFGLSFDEILLAYLFTAANVLLLWLLLKQLGLAARLVPHLLALFFLGTIYLSALVIGRSWFLSHLIATTFLFLALCETLGPRRPLLVGLFLGLSFLTRSTTLFAFPIFVLLLRRQDSTRPTLRSLARPLLDLALGLVPALAFFFFYNAVRFGSPFETGYGQAIVGSAVLTGALQLGLFSPVHLAKNLYALFLAVPLAYSSFSSPLLSFPYLYPSPWGASLFFTTPAFVYALAAGWRTGLVRAAGLACFLIALPLLFYYGVGWIQFGYRYALDFYPFLFIPTALGLARVPLRRAQLLIMLCILINLWGAWWQMVGFRTLPAELLR